MYLCDTLNVLMPENGTLPNNNNISDASNDEEGTKALVLLLKEIKVPPTNGRLC